MKKLFSIKDIAYIGMAVALIESCKMALAFLPNIELTSFWLVMFTLLMGWKTLIIVPIFVAIEGSLYGPHVWVIMYLYVWPILILLTLLFRKNDKALFWALLSGFFGLAFGALCTPAQVIFFVKAKTLEAGFKAGFAWWISGIPYDVAHAIGNFTIMLVLYRPIRIAVNKLKTFSH
jgi:hypothetical protein